MVLVSSCVLCVQVNTFFLFCLFTVVHKFDFRFVGKLTRKKWWSFEDDRLAFLMGSIRFMCELRLERKVPRLTLSRSKLYS
jgi:hypothetical protein